MGGGDLNLKKSWHPGLMRNQEAVWKKEQEALDERKKIAERQREIQEEREMNELQAMQEAAGGKKRVDRVDWMYQAPQGGNMGVTSEVEAFLLGKNTVDELLLQAEGAAVLKEDQDKFMKVDSDANSSRDVATKVREDPMFMIRKEQQAVVNAIKNNPKRMAELRAARDHSRSKVEESSRISKPSTSRSSRDKPSSRSHHHHSSSSRHRDSERDFEASHRHLSSRRHHISSRDYSRERDNDRRDYDRRDYDRRDYDRRSNNRDSRHSNRSENDDRTRRTEVSA
ncbi:Pre-mRNA splicing factor-domain-containing protein [Lipomyces japonicus]|uniref:Pre-mRNA splicing factor-domain-containing protein n=1 Tax=Lipomyces japonicus TaxID=56871 RepID=UPI0034CD53ED